MKTGKKILVINGSPKVGGNTDALIEWISDGAAKTGAQPEVVRLSALKFKACGCISCRACQDIGKYECAIDDDARPVLAKMVTADVIVMATPLYFFSASAQLKVVIDRMFALYKWDNSTGAFTSPLKGKMLAVVASAYEDVGLDALERPFRLTAEYTGMGFRSFLVPNAGVSGNIKNVPGIIEKSMMFGKELAD